MPSLHAVSRTAWACACIEAASYSRFRSSAWPKLMYPGRPKAARPRPMRETIRPVFPRVRVCIRGTVADRGASVDYPDVTLGMVTRDCADYLFALEGLPKLRCAVASRIFASCETVHAPDSGITQEAVQRLDAP